MTSFRLSRRGFAGALASGAAGLGAEIGLSEDHKSGRLYARRYAPALCSDGEHAILSGGAPIGAGRNDQHFYSSLLGMVEAIAPQSLEQTFLATAIFPRANHASVFVDGQIWLLGGRTREGTEGRLVSETERIDPVTQAIWRGPDLPEPLIHLSAALVDRSVYVFGGVARRQGAQRSVAVNEVWECSPPYDRWVPRAPMLFALGNASAVMVGGQVFVVGGYNQEQAQAIIQVYDPVADSWFLGSPPPLPLSAHASASANGRIFVFGDYTHQATVLGYDAAADQWRELSVPFTTRRHVRATRVGDRIVVAGGNQSSEAPATDALESYSISKLNEAFDTSK